jgi:YggT family protein
VLVQLIDLYMLIVLGAVIISWVQLPPTHTVAIVLRTLTEPVLNPIRRVLPPMRGLDFSPLVLLVALQFIRRLL